MLLIKYKAETYPFSVNNLLKSIIFYFSIKIAF